MDPLPLKELNCQQKVPGHSSASKRKIFTSFNPVAPSKRFVDPDRYCRLVHELSLCQPDVPFLTIADCLKHNPLSEQHSVVVDVVPTLPEQMGLDDVLLVPTRNESVHTSLPEPLSLVDRAEQFVTTYQGQ